MRYSAFFKCITVLCLLLLASWCSNPLLTSAHQKEAVSDEIKLPETDRLGSITIELWYDGQIVTGGMLEVYRVGEIYIKADKSGCGFDKIGAFTAFKGRLVNVQSEETVRQLAEFVSENALPADYSVENKEGRVTLDRLQTGLYLIIQSEASKGYEALNPFLVSVPVMEEGEYVYDVDAHGKFELKTVPPEPTPTPTPGPTPTPTPTPGSTPTPTPTPGSTSEPTPAPTWEPTPTPTSEPTPTPTSTSEPTPTPSSTSELTPTPGSTWEPASTSNPDHTPELSAPSTEKLPQTGQLNWPVPLLAVSGITLLLIGLALRLHGGRKDSEENGQNG